MPDQRLQTEDIETSPLVLIADDDPLILDLVGRILRKDDYRVATACTGAEALDKVRELRPDLALLDVNMPRMSGYDVCQEVKADTEPSVALMPIILITGGAEPEDKIKALEVGADDMLSKPVSSTELRARVKWAVRTRRAQEGWRRAEKERLELESDLKLERFQREEEGRRRAFYKDVILSVTDGVLVLVEKDEMDTLLQEVFHPLRPGVELEGASSVGSARDLARVAAEEKGFAEDLVDDVVLCVSEAATNTIKHAREGRMRLAGEGDTLRILFEDRGPGIDATTLPKATLMKGYSTKISLGFGFTILLKLMDRVSLDTRPDGTRLLLEKGPRQKRVDFDDGTP